MFVAHAPILGSEEHPGECELQEDSWESSICKGLFVEMVSRFNSIHCRHLSGHSSHCSQFSVMIFKWLPTLGQDIQINTWSGHWINYLSRHSIKYLSGHCEREERWSHCRNLCLFHLPGWVPQIALLYLLCISIKGSNNYFGTKDKKPFLNQDFEICNSIHVLVIQKAKLGKNFSEIQVPFNTFPNIYI